jgi:hypothetical protein
MLKTMSMEWGPIYVLLVVAFVLHPFCNLLDEDMRKRALLNEKNRGRLTELPMSIDYL